MPAFVEHIVLAYINTSSTELEVFSKSFPETLSQKIAKLNNMRLEIFKMKTKKTEKLA